MFSISEKGIPSVEPVISSKLPFKGDNIFLSFIFLCMNSCLSSEFEQGRVSTLSISPACINVSPILALSFVVATNSIPFAEQFFKIFANLFLSTCTLLLSSVYILSKFEATTIVLMPFSL